MTRKLGIKKATSSLREAVNFTAVRNQGSLALDVQRKRAYNVTIFPFNAIRDCLPPRRKGIERSVRIHLAIVS
jgi:hypothetical protein